jgi:hypothetical protein
MGNSVSNQTEPQNIKSLSQTIDDIAIHYILKQNVIDLLRLTDKEYYDNLIVLIGNVFDNRLTNLEIGILSGRINETVQDAIFSLLPATDNIKNKMISNISKFYIKIMMIYSAIVATIDPQYSYEDEQGQKQFFYLKDMAFFKKIPRESSPVLHQLTNPMNLCRKRITILKNKLETNEDDFIVVNPGEKLCSIDSATKLTDEIGIKELDLLYYDIFDYSNKSWKKRSKEMEEKYKKDLTLFYQIFTGKSVMPNEIRSFKDIELLDLKNIEYCNDPLFKQDFTVSKNDKLIHDYIEQIHTIEEEVKVYRTKLTEILKSIFLIKMTGEEQTYTINPDLTMPEILKLEAETRDTIISLYTNCERNFIKALLIFEEIYDIQSRDSNQNRIKNIDSGNIEKGLGVSALNTTSFSNFDNPSSREPLFNNKMVVKSEPGTNSQESQVQTNTFGMPESALPSPLPSNSPPEPLSNSPEPSPSNSPPEPLSNSPEPSPSNSAELSPSNSPVESHSNSAELSPSNSPVETPSNSPPSNTPEPSPEPVSNTAEPVSNSPPSNNPEPSVVPSNSAEPSPSNSPPSNIPEPSPEPVSNSPEPSPEPSVVPVSTEQSQESSLPSALKTTSPDVKPKNTIQTITENIGKLFNTTLTPAPATSTETAPATVPATVPSTETASLPEPAKV